MSHVLRNTELAQPSTHLIMQEGQGGHPAAADLDHSKQAVVAAFEGL